MSRFVIAIGASIAAWLVAATSVVHAEDCGLPAESPAASVSWLGLNSPDSSATGSSATLTVRNLSRETAEFRVSVYADFGTPRGRSKRYRLRNVAPGTSQNVIVDLERLRPPAEMAYAGQLLAVAEIRRDGACEDRACNALRSNPDVADDIDAGGIADPTRAGAEGNDLGEDLIVSQPLFFHRAATPGTFELYGSEILTGRYGAGALAAPVDFDEPDTVLQRVSDAGKGLADNAKRSAEVGISAGTNELGAPAADDDPAPKDGYRLCVRWEVQVTEQGRKVKNVLGDTITEDYWHGYSKPGGSGFIASGVPANTGKMIVTARGPRVLVKKDGWSYGTNADPVNGCFSFTAPVDGPFNLFVFGEHHDSHGNKTIVRTKDGLGVAWSKSVNPQKGKTRSVLVGNYDGNATLAAMSGFAMYRSTMGMSDKTIDLRATDTCAKENGNNSSAHHRTDGLEDGIAYIRLNDGTGTGSVDGKPCTAADHRRAKFIAMHEMGHAWLLLRTKQKEPNVNLDLEDDDEHVCSQGASYTPDSLEWSAVGAREGAAHFYASIVWNNPASAFGVFSMWGTGRDIETYTSESGGQLWNKCDANVKCGRTVIMDWARFWWDMHTPVGPGRLSQDTIARIYARAIANGGLTPDNYYEKFEAAMEQEVADPTLRANFKSFATWNGVDTSPSGPSCVAPYTYPNCQGDEGSPGCPCTDVLQLNANSAHLASTDGYHGDGQGSYAATGEPQYCLDSGNDKVVCGLTDYAFGNHYAPVCQVCGEDTMIGCPCSNDDQCNNAGLDGELLGCFGAPANGWAGSDPGVCLPSASSVAGRERLTEMPWFCLDNCGSKGSNYTCLYDQLEPSIENDHARCVEAVACDPPAGYCEAGGAMCSVEASCAFDWDQCCVAECSNDTDCDLLGFPDTYACSAGSCVPTECNGSFSQYCSLYR